MFIRIRRFDSSLACPHLSHRWFVFKREYFAREKILTMKMKSSFKVLPKVSGKTISIGIFIAFFYDFTTWTFYLVSRNRQTDARKIDDSPTFRPREKKEKATRPAAFESRVKDKSVIMKKGRANLW